MPVIQTHEKTYRLLIIDDDPGWIQFAKANLGKSFEVNVTTDLENALARLRQNHYDLIIVSSRRLDVVERIHTQFPQERIVVAAGQETVGEAIYAYRLGVFDYFAKDFRSEIITKKLNEAIQKPVVNPV
ncbi:MAG TPA: response regulator [Anaerolineae bacterium]|jgi:DNA-binding NtrC family response regulator